MVGDSLLSHLLAIALPAISYGDYIALRALDHGGIGYTWSVRTPEHIWPEIDPKDGSIKITAAYGDMKRGVWDGVSWQLVVRHNSEGVSGVELTSPDEQLTPQDLADFTWPHWLRIAEEIRQHNQASALPPADGDFWAQIAWEQSPDPQGTARVDEAIRTALLAAPQRPGSAGHGDDFYRLVARAYIDLLGQGHPAPIQALADEMERHRDTVGTWISKARDKGYLTDLEDQ